MNIEEYAIAGAFVVVPGIVIVLLVIAARSTVREVKVHERSRHLTTAVNLCSLLSIASHVYFVTYLFVLPPPANLAGFISGLIVSIGLMIASVLALIICAGLLHSRINGRSRNKD